MTPPNRPPPYVDEERRARIIEHIDALRKEIRDSQEDYSLQRLASLFGVSLEAPVTNVTPDYRAQYLYLKNNVVPPLEEEIRSLSSQLDAYEKDEKPPTHQTSELSVTDAMSKFCTVCTDCSSITNSYPDCIEDKRRPPEYGSSARTQDLLIFHCTLCQAEFKRVYNLEDHATELCFGCGLETDEDDDEEDLVEHEHTILFCCLHELVTQVLDGGFNADDLEIDQEKLKEIFGYLFLHLEEWDPVTTDEAAGLGYAPGYVVEPECPTCTPPHSVEEIFREAEDERERRSECADMGPGCTHE